MAGPPHPLKIDMPNFLERLEGSLITLKKGDISLPFSSKEECWNILLQCPDLILKFSKTRLFTGSFEDLAQKLYPIVDHPGKGLWSLSNLRLAYTGSQDSVTMRTHVHVCVLSVEWN